MSAFEKLHIPRNVLVTATTLGISALSMSGCSSTNYSGEGNEFTIRGPVLDVNDTSVKIMPINILEVNGKAEKWFTEDDETRVHDHYKNNKCKKEEVGTVLDLSKTEIESNVLQEGNWVEIVGKIRESKSSCDDISSWDWRPVFDFVREMPKR